MTEYRYIRVDLGDEWNRNKIQGLFRKALKSNDLLREDYLYHIFDGVRAIDLVRATGCDAENPQHYSCGVASGIMDRRSDLYNPLDTGVMLEKPGLLVYKRRSLVVVDEAASFYRFKGRDYMRGLVALLLAKRPRSSIRPDLQPEL